MPILKLHLENVGPFDALELDFTDGKGNAHLGPHILTGVNGSGKTTVLKAIAACLAEPLDSQAVIAGRSSADHGFDEETWLRLLKGRSNSSTEVLLGPTETAGSRIKVVDSDQHWVQSLMETEIYEASPVSEAEMTEADWEGLDEQREEHEALIADQVRDIWDLGCVATYSPQPRLRWLAELSFQQDTYLRKGWLSFDSTIDNRRLQDYWVDCFSREALSQRAKTPKAPSSVDAIRKAVKAIFTGSALSAQEAEPTVTLDGRTRPALLFGGMELDFSQLPSGVNATLSWVVDYLMRRDAFRWRDEQSSRAKPGVILIDEIETHLHPQWQRRILNGIRAAFPNTQIIVTTHSPFVVTSCEDARVHMLQVDKKGRAFIAETIERPDGTSVDATIHGVFGIKGRFGPEVEDLLTEWNELKKRDHFGKLNAKEKSRLRSLVKKIASRGEELAAMVHEPVLSDELLEELLSATGPIPKRR